MALSSSLALANNAGTTITFVENKRTGFRVERLNGATTLQLPSRLVVDHSTTGKDKTLADRHLIQIATTESDGNGGTATTVVNLTISVPRSATSSTAAKDAVCALAKLLLTTNAANATFDAILQNQS